jgi:YfiH family protein
MILPRPDPAFSWQITTRGPALVCEPLARLAPHFFTSATWWLGARDQRRNDHPDGWEEIRTEIDVAPKHLARMRQVHGSASVVATANGAPPLPVADIIVSVDPLMAIAVQAADCVPLLLADRRSGAVAAAHAGWRGLAADVPGIAVDTLRQHYGTKPEDLVVAAGPSIGACCYQVGPDVYDAFARTGAASASMSRWFRQTPATLAGNPPFAGVPASAVRDRWFFDGWAAARDLLVAAGVSPASVHQCGLCTASHPALFCSYRRDGAPAGRMAGEIRAPSRRP